MKHTMIDESTLVLEARTPSDAELTRMIDLSMQHLNAGSNIPPLMDRHRNHMLREMRAFVKRTANRRNCTVFTAADPVSITAGCRFRHEISEHGTTWLLHSKVNARGADLLKYMQSSAGE